MSKTHIKLLLKYVHAIAKKVFIRPSKRNQKEALKFQTGMYCELQQNLFHGKSF